MSDFALYNALRAKPDYDQKRKDANYALELMSNLGQQEFGELQRRKEALGQIGDRLNQAGQDASELLDPDAERLLAAEKKIRQPYIDELGKFGNDAEMFQLMGGDELGKKYSSDLMNLPELKRGILNKQNFTKALADQQAGKNIRPVSYTGADGQPISGEFDQNVADFQAGKTSEINYNGGYDSPKGDLLEFTKIPNPNNPYKSDFVDWGMLGNWLQLKEGLSPQDAVHWMKANKSMLQNPNDPNKTNIPWGVKEKPNDGAQWARLAWDKWKFEHPQAKPEAEMQLFADNAYGILTNPKRWNIVPSPGSGNKFVGTNAFSGLQIKQSQKAADGTLKDLNRKLVYIMRFPEDNNLYPLFQDQVDSGGGFNALNAKKNSPIDENDLFNSLIVPTITGTYGANADAKLEKLRDYVMGKDAPSDMADRLGVPHISGSTGQEAAPEAPAAQPPATDEHPPIEQGGFTYTWNAESGEYQ